MKNYPRIIQQTGSWCLPASLEIVLKSKGVEVSQEEIAKFFGIGRENGFRGMDRDITRFLQEKKLPFLCKQTRHNEVFPDIETWMEENLHKDILVSYYYPLLVHGKKRDDGKNGHFSVLVDFYLQEQRERVKLFDPSPGEIFDYSFLELTRAMPVLEDSGSGFYAIEKIN
jgi:hypothetical protein